MPKYFVGELSEVRLLEVLKPLLDAKRTGMVSIRGKDAGEIYLETGKVVHVKTARSAGEDAFLSMMGWKTGRLTFETDVAANEKSITVTSEDLLTNWLDREQEIDKIREVVPSPNLVFHISMQKGREDKSVSAEHWNVLALCDGTKKVSEISVALGWDEFKTSRVLYQLLKTGMVERSAERPVERVTEQRIPEQKRYVNGNFFPMIENELKKVMGPIAGVIIDDKLGEFGRAKDSFPHDQTEPFVEALSEEIANAAKRKEFVKTMMDFIAISSTIRQTGEWLKYDIVVDTSTNYNFQFRVGTMDDHCKITVAVDDTTVGTVDLPNTGGYTAFQTVHYEPNKSITAGTHGIKLTFTGEFVFDNFRLY